MPSPHILKGPNEGALVPLGNGVVIGRNPSCGVVIPSTSVAREHAQITRGAGGYVIEDLRSRPGTWLNREQIFGPTTLRDGDQIRICDFVAVFLDDTPATHRPELSILVPVVTKA